MVGPFFVDTRPATYYVMQYEGADMLTLRLDPTLEQNIKITAKRLGLSKSELIRKSILSYLEKVEHVNAWETGNDLFGKHSSGLGNLSTDRKKLIKTKLQAKNQ